MAASEPAGRRAEPAGPEPPGPTHRPRRRPAGVSVVVGGLLQDLEDRVRRDVAPIEERARPGEEARGLAGAGDDGAPGRLLIVLPVGPVDAGRA